MARGQVEHGRWSGQSSNGDDGSGFHRMVGKEGRKGAVIAAFGGFGCWFRTVISQRAHFDELDVSTVEYVTNRTVHSNFFCLTLMHMSLGKYVPSWLNVTSIH